MWAADLSSNRKKEQCSAVSKKEALQRRPAIKQGQMLSEANHIAFVTYLPPESNKPCSTLYLTGKDVQKTDEKKAASHKDVSKSL